MLAKGSRFLGVLLALATLAMASEAVAAQSAKEGKGAKSRKPAWKWTVEERLAARFDPDAMKARAARQRVKLEEIKKLAPDMVVDSRPSREDAGWIDGAETPELFLPWELFNHFLEVGFTLDEDRAEARRYIDERAAALGFGEDFWSRLENLASPFLQIRYERFQRAMEKLAMKKRAMEEGATEEVVEPPRSVVEKRYGLDMDREDLLFCRTQAEALAAAKAEFGEEAFLRLLYEVVAPPMGMGYPVDKESRERSRFLEGGCQ